MKGMSNEKDGTITYLDSTLKAEIGHIDLHNVGIFDLEDLSGESSKESLTRMRAHLYCERMNFVFSKPGKPPAP